MVSDCFIFSHAVFHSIVSYYLYRMIGVSVFAVRFNWIVFIIEIFESRINLIMGKVMLMLNFIDWI